MFCVGAFYRQAFASMLICQPFSFRNIWWCFVLVPSTGRLLQAFWFVNLSHSEIFDDVLCWCLLQASFCKHFWFVNLSHSEIFDDVLCWCLLQASFCKHFGLSTFLIQKYLMMFCVGAFYRQAFASILLCQPFSFRNIWWCFVLVPSTGKLLQAFWFVNLSHSEIFDDVLCWCLLQASFCKHFDLSTFLIQKYLMMFCVGAFYRQAFASILICQPFSFRNIWWCFVLVPSTGKLLQAFWFVNLSHSEIFGDVLCWCLLQASFCKHFDLSTFLIQKYLMMFCVGAFYRQAFASILICQPFSFRNIRWCFVLVPSTGKLLQAFWFVNLSHSEIFDDVLCWCLLQASFCKHFDLSTFLIQKYLVVFCVGAFYRQAFASISICQPFSFRNIWWCFVLVPSTGKLLQACWFVNLSHSEIFGDVLCWCLLQASFCKHFDLSTFLIQKYLMMFCVGAFYRQAFASILICQPSSFRNIWWCFVMAPSTGKLLQACWFVNLSHSEIFDDVLCWCLLQASFCKHVDLSTFLIQKYLVMFCVGAFYRQAFASILICQPFSFRNIWCCFVLVPSTGKLLQAFWFVNLSHSEIFDAVLCWCLLQASFCKHFDLSTFLIQKYLMLFCVGAFYRQAFASILICQPFSFRNSWWCFVLVPSTGKLLQAFWFVNLSHSEIFDDVLCWCLLQASFCKHFDLSTFLIQKYLMMFCAGAFYRQAFASILICQISHSEIFDDVLFWWLLQASFCKHFDLSTFLIQKYLFVNLSHSEIFGDVLCWCLLQASFCKHFDLSTFIIQKYLMMFCVGAFYRQAFASTSICQPFSFRNIWWCFVLVPSTGKLLQAFWFVNLSHSEIFDDVLCWCLLQASFCKHFDLSTFLIQKKLMMFCVGAFYRQAFASILICQPFSFRNIWWCFVLVPSTGKLLQAFWFVNLSHSEIFDDVLCWCLLQASFCKHFDLSTFLIQKYLMMFCVGAFYMQAFFVNLSHSEIFDDVLCWCLLQASFCKHFDLSTFLIQKYLMMFCVGAFYRQAFASILICQPFSFRNIWWCFVLVPSTGKLLQAFWFVNLSHSEIFDDVLCWCLLQASFCKHFDLSTFLIQKKLMMFCVGAFYRQAFASILINLSHSEIFDDVLCWCLLQASFCKHFDLSTFLIQKYLMKYVLCWCLLQASFCKHFDLSTFLIQSYLMMFCVGAFYRQAFASILICQPFSFRNIWWCFVLVPSTGKLLQAFWFVNLSHSEIFDDVLCWCLLQASFCKHFDWQPFSFRNIWWCFVLVPSTGKLWQAFWFVNLSHSEMFDDVLCWCLLQASFCKHFDLSTFLIQKYLMMFCVGAFYRQAFASILICQPFSFRNIWWCFVLVPSTGKLLQAFWFVNLSHSEIVDDVLCWCLLKAFWFVNLSHSEIFDDVLCWCLLQAGFCKHFDLSTFLIQKYLMMFCVGAFYRQAFASILICQPFSFRNIWWCFVLVPSTGKLLQAFRFVNLSHSEIFDDVLCWCLLQASFCKHFDLSTCLIQKYLMMFCVGAFYRQAFASILICQPFSFRNIWWCFVLVPSESILICQPFSFRNIWWCFVLVTSTGKLLQAFWFVNLSHSEIFDDVLCWCLLQASFCKHFDLSTFLIQKYLMMFCVGAFYRQAFASILIFQPFSLRNIWWCFVLVPSTGKLWQAFWFVNLSHSEIFDDVLCWCLLQPSCCKHFDLSTFLIQKYLMMFCVGAFYRQAFASILICQPFSFRKMWWCFVLGKLLQAFWFVNLSHSEIFDDVLCWCLLQASFCKHFDLPTFLIQKYLMMFCVGVFYTQAFASILICQPFSFRNIWWCFVLVPSTGKLLQAFWFFNLSHSEIFDDVLCWCLLQASFCKHFDFSTFLIQKYLMMFCVGAFYRQAFASILICQPFSFRNIWWCFVLVPSTGKLLQAFWFFNLSHSEIFDDVCVGAFYRQAFASILICQPFSFRNIWWCYVLVPSTGKLLHAFWFVNLSHSEIFDDVLCWCLLQASFCKHFDLPTFLIQKYLMMFCVGVFYTQAFASILICQPFSFRNIWWCFVLVPSTGKLLQAFWFFNLSHSEIFDDVLCWCLLQASFCKHFDFSTFLIQKYLMMFCVGAFYRQAFASILICQPFSFRNIWWCFVLVPSTGKLLQAFWFFNLSHSEIFDDVLCWCLLKAFWFVNLSHSEIFDDVLCWWLLQASFCKHFDLSTFLIQKYLMMFCVGAFYRQAFASISTCQPFSFRNIWWCFVLVPSTGKLLQAFWFFNLSHWEIFDGVLCWCLLQASFGKHFDLSTFLIQKYLMMFCVGAFYRQAVASILICQPFSFRNIWWCFVLVPSTGKLLQAFWFVNLSHSEKCDDVLCWASFCKHFDLSTFLIQKYLMMFCVGAFYRQVFASILICQPFSFRNIWWCFVLVSSTRKLLQAFWFVNLSHSEIFDDVLCWCLLQASFCKHFDFSTFLIQKYLMMFCVGAFYRQAFASILIFQPFSFRNIWWCFVLVPSTGKLLQAFWFVNLSHSEIFDDVLCWCLLQASFCKHFDFSTFLIQKYLMMFVLVPSTGKLLQAFWFVNLSHSEIFDDVMCWCLPQASFCTHFDLSTFLIQKYLMMFCVGAFYRQVFASILICQPFSFRNIWWCFVLVSSTRKLLQAFWFVNLSHSEIFDDVLCWCLLQASFCKHFDFSTFLIQKYLMMFCVGAFYRQAFASILIFQPFSFRNIWWCFVLVPSTGKLLQAFWFVNLSHSEIFDDVLCWCLLQASFCKHFDFSTFLIQKYLMMFVLVPSTGKLLQAFWFVNLSHSEIFDDVMCWCLPQASFCTHFDLSTFLIQKYLMMFCAGAFYRQAFASILIFQPFSFRNLWWCFVLVPSTGKFLQAFWFVNLSHSEIFDDVLCWCLLQASFCKHFDLSTFLIQKYLMMFCVGAFYRQAFASILICQPFSFRNIWWCFVLVPSTGKLLQAFWFVNLSHSEIFDDVLCWFLVQASFCKHFDLSTFLIQKYLMMFCVGFLYRQAFASILICQPFSFRNIWWCFVLVPSTRKLLQALWFVNLSHS